MSSAHKLLRALPLLAMGAVLVAGETPRVGKVPLDETLLVDDPALQHLAPAIEGGDTLRICDLLLGSPKFIAAPNPSQLNAQVQVAQAAKAPVSDPITLRILSYNVGLLDRTYLFTSRVVMPHIAERKPAQVERLFADNWDILLFQELWENEDLALYRKSAEAHGYVIYGGTDKHHVQHGLAIAVRQSLLGPEAQEQEEHQFQKQRRAERWPGPNVKRGWLEWEFTLAGTNRRVHLLNTHPQSFASWWQVRLDQVRELGLAANEAAADALVILGGDLNASPYYPFDSFGEIDGKPVTEWWANATAWPALLHYGGLTDMAIATGQAQDVQRMDELPPYGKNWMEVGLGGACETMPVDTFTGTDCNSLYFTSYAGMEYSGRLDYLMYRDDQDKLRVKSSWIHYADKSVPTADGKMVELSDHYAMAAEIELGR